MQLAGMADDGGTEHELGTAAGMPRRVVPGPDHEVGPGRPGHDAGRLDGVGPAGGTPGAPPAGNLHVAGQHRTEVPRLVGHGVIQLGDLGVARALGHARVGRREVV
jgi:hypothetical protein